MKTDRVKELEARVLDLTELAAAYEIALEGIRSRAYARRDFREFEDRVDRIFRETYDRRKRLFPGSPNAGAEWFIRPPKTDTEGFTGDKAV